MNLDIDSMAIQKLNISEFITETKFQYSMYSTKCEEFSEMYSETDFGNLIEDYLNWFSIKYIIHECSESELIGRCWYIEIDGKCRQYALEGKKEEGDLLYSSVWNKSKDFMIRDGNIEILKANVMVIVNEYKRSQFKKI